MPYRSRARFLAPLALLAAALTIYLVVQSELGTTASPSSADGASTSTTARPTTGSAKPSTTPTRTTSGSSAPSGATGAGGTARYTVQPGDVLSAISEETGVTVEDLLAFNDIDAQSLRVGQKLRLTAP